MALKARPPEAVTKRLKLFMFGPAGVGKTTAAIQFPNCYIIDAEKGAENYDRLINASGSVVMQTTMMEDVIQEVKTLLTEKHEYRTLVIDPITPLFNDLLDKSAEKVGEDFGRHYGAANKVMKRFANLIMSLDMNVIITAHAKKEYGQNLAVLGNTFDGWKQLDYWFDLVIELSKAGKKRFGKVAKTRIETFPDEERFEWSYDAVRERYEKQYGVGVLDREAIALALAAPEQVREVRELLNIVKLPDGLADKWLAKAQADRWEDMPADAIAKCIDYIRNRMTAEVPV
jgi:hypothetical protein